MANVKHFTGGEGAIWMQPDGPGTDMVFLGCHEVSGIDEPLGDYSPFFCPDPSSRNKWVESGEITSPPDAVSTSILEDVVDSLSDLEKQKCPFWLYVNLISCGRRDVFTNAVKTFALDVRKITNRSYSNLSLRDSSDRAEVSHDISAAPPLNIFVSVAPQAQSLPDATGA